MITTLPPKAYPQIIDLIQETEPIDSILSAGIDEEGVIFCLALEGDEQISVKIGDTIETRSFNAESQTVKMAAPVPDLVDEYVGRIEKQNHFKPWLEQTQELLMQSSDLNEFSDLLDSLYPDLSSVEFSKAMRGAMTAASMGGYFEADTEIEGELEFKQAEGSKRTKNGVQYVLINSRWRRADKKKAAQPAIEPVAEIARTHKQLISDFFKDPKKSIEDGMAREKAARDKFAAKHSGSKSLELADKALKLKSDVAELAKKNSDTIKATAIGEGLPMIGSLAGSAIGTALAGPLGAMAGDAIGSAGTRKAMEVVASYKKAAAALATDEAHSSASKLQQFKNIGAGTLSDLKDVETQKALQNSLVGDIGGWAIGNAVGKALSVAMPTGYGPLIGAVGASMALVPNVIQPLAAQAHDLVRGGASPKDAVIKVTADLVGKGDNAVKGLRSKLVSGLNNLRSKVQSNKYASS